MAFKSEEEIPRKVEVRPFRHVRISERHFKLLGEFIQSEAGIKMPPAKKTMLEARLQRRLRALGMDSFDEYCDYLFGDEGGHDEVVDMIDVVTTNKTDFFREPSHYGYLVDHALPEMMRLYNTGQRKPFAVWSAGCSTGEEPYTLAMVLADFAHGHEGFKFFILATDISTQVLEKAAVGIYDASKVEDVPPEMKTRYLMRSKDRSIRKVRIVPELRALVSFRRLNFMSEDFGMREKMDMIFCRNVIIYFERRTQEKLLNRLCSHLVPGGYIFMGHSETLHGLNVPRYPVAPTVYRLPH